MTNSSFHRASAQRRHITSFTSLLEFILWGSESPLFYFISHEIIVISFWIVPQKLKIAVEAPYSRFGTRFWVWLIFYSPRLKTRQNGLFWNQNDFGFIYQIWKRGNFSFLKPGRFRTARYPALHNTENGAISEKPKNENRSISARIWDRLNFGHFKAQKKPW